MALMNIVLYPDDPLKQTAEPFDPVGRDVEQLAEDMLETMYTYEGVGLAGPQVGIAKRLFVMHEPEGEAMCLVNPEIYEKEGQEAGEEGCLSLPEIYAPVDRATRIRVRACNQRGEPMDFEARDLQARIIQHETDHLDGVCFVDRLDLLTRQEKLEEWVETRGRIMAAVKGD